MHRRADRQLAALGRHGSAKAAKEALARYFAVALAQKGITVNIISPGACDDSVLSGLPPQVFQMIKDWHESWSAHEAPRRASRCRQRRVLLCTDQASFITGQLLYVDGGASAMEPVFPFGHPRASSSADWGIAHTACRDRQFHLSRGNHLLLLGQAATQRTSALFDNPVLLGFPTATASNKSDSCDEQPLPRIQDRRKHAQCTSRPSRISLKRRTRITCGKPASWFCTALLISACLQISTAKSLFSKTLPINPLYRRLCEPNKG